MVKIRTAFASHNRHKACDKEPGFHITEQVRLLSEKDKEIQILKAENRALLKEKQEILKGLETLCQKFGD